jgi:membrane-bound hydrogenase subunit beta
MMERNSLSAQQVADIFELEFGTAVKGVQIAEWTEGAKKTPIRTIWIELDRDRLKDAIRRLVEIDFPHLGVVSGADTGDAIELMYHLYIYFGIRNGEIGVTFKVSLPKSDLRVQTISDIIPGAVYTEREKQEMLGIEVIGIPDKRGLFLPEDFPKGVYPWRKDETGITDDMVKHLWAVGRPEDRPAPPVAPKEKKKPEPKPPAEEKSVSEEKPGAETPEVAPKETVETTKDTTGSENQEVKPDE